MKRIGIETHSFDVQMLIDGSDYADRRGFRERVMPLRWSFDGVCLLFLLTCGTSGADKIKLRSSGMLMLEIRCFD